MTKNLETMMQMSANIQDKMWDFLVASTSSFSLTQEQAEKMAQTYIEQRKINRQEAAKLTDELLVQVRKNQQKMREIVADGVKAAFSGNAFAEHFKSNDISQKLDELEKKIEDLKR